MITVMTGQVVDFFDRDFRELYAISEKLDLYKEFHVSPPATKVTTTVRSKVGPKRPPLQATTSRFQVTLGDSPKADIQVPAYKYYNPKYSLVVGDMPRPTGSLQERGPKTGSLLAECPEDLEPKRTSSDKVERLNSLPSEAPSEPFKMLNGVTQEKKGWATWKKKFTTKKSASKISINNPTDSPLPTATRTDEEQEDSFEVVVVSPPKSRGKKTSKLGQRTESGQTINTAHDNESKCGIKRIMFHSFTS